MKNLFKTSKENANYQSPKKIPDSFFQDNTHCPIIPTLSRLSASFEQMLNLPPARQMFQRYLNGERLHGILLCLRELIATSHCNEKCSFASVSLSDNIEHCVDQIDDAVNGIDSKTDDTDIDIHRQQIDADLMLRCKSADRTPCHYLSIYANYLSIGTSEASDDVWRFAMCTGDAMMPYRLLVEIFQMSHQNPLPSFQKLEKCIYNNLCSTFYPNYLKSAYHHQYQLQLLNSGLNTLQLADFLYSDDYIMIITDFLEMKGLVDYLSFLIAVINLAGNTGKCSFNDALDVYSKFLVMDSGHFIELPASVTNRVVNQMCQFNSPTSPSVVIKMNPNIIFECAFRPVYLFLEQYWLPEFLTCTTYQRSVTRLHQTIQVYQSRMRNHSETIYNGPTANLVGESVVPDDAKSDISADNTSVQSEPLMSFSVTTDNPSEFSANSNLWWPSKHLEGLRDGRPSRICRPMSLGSFDDLGRYQSQTNKNKQDFPPPDSTSSEILTTISELGSDLWNKLYTNPTTESRPNVLSPDEIARQIINDVHLMTLKNQ